MRIQHAFIVTFFAALAFSAAAEAQEIATAQAPAAIRPQRFVVPPSSRLAADINPAFFVNTRQAQLRDHHLAKAPPATTIRLAPLADLAPAAMGNQTTVVAAGAPGSPIVMPSNRPLTGVETNNITSTVLEPSTAVTSDGFVLYTGNWFAAVSKDNGQTFSYRNPYDVFSGGGSRGFCCDQVAAYDSARDILFWYLQGVQDGTGNVGRLVFAKGADIRNENWQYYDLTAANIGGFTNEWFDFPDLALSNRFLYVSTNSFATQGTPDSNDDTFARALMIRLDLDQIAAGAEIRPEFFASADVFSLRPTQGASNTMYFASHDFADFGKRIVVFSWPDNVATVSRRSVQVDAWSNDSRESVSRDGNQWLRRADARMTAAWVIGSEAGFAWTASAAGPFRNPHVRAAVIDTTATTTTPVRQPHLWNDQYAFAYPAAYGSAMGTTAGVSVQYGGGGAQGFNPSHAVGVLKRASDGSYSWILQASDNGSNGPADGRWGDYLSVRPRNGGGWSASGYTLHGGSLPGNIVPRMVFFQEAPAIAAIAAAERAGPTTIRSDLEQIRARIDTVLQRLDAAGIGR